MAEMASEPSPSSARAGKEGWATAGDLHPIRQPLGLDRVDLPNLAKVPNFDEGTG